MRHLPLSIPELSSGTGEVAHLLCRIVAIPRRLWLACWFATMASVVDFKLLDLSGLHCMTSIRQAAGCMDLVRLEYACVDGDDAVRRRLEGRSVVMRRVGEFESRRATFWM
jgi:hypothetical protein